MAHHLPLRVPSHLYWMLVDAPPCVRVFQYCGASSFLLLFRLVVDDDVLPHYLFLLECENSRFAGSAYHLHHIRSLHSV